MPAVPAVLLDQLADARRAGVPFRDAWSPAFEVAVRTATYGQREAWREALHDTRSAWRSAFLRRPAKGRELALASVTADLGSKTRQMPEANERTQPAIAAA